MRVSSSCWAICSITAALLYLVPSRVAQAYDPLELPQGVTIKTVDLTVHDEARSRDIPLRIYLPKGEETAPVILFSHGLGGNCKGGAYLGRHWSARGYVGVFVQHPGSDDSVWKDRRASERMKALRAAASGENFMFRVRDIPAVLDQLEKWNRETGHPLYQRLDLEHVGMSGHSFGAVTTQAVSGQTVPLIGQRLCDKRIRAAMAFSPSTPRRGDPRVAFGRVPIPWMLMTGTKDVAPIGDADVAARLNVYPHLPDTICKYELVLDNAEHSAFGDRALPGDQLQRNPNHHRAILALSTAFWDTHLRDDAAARKWLHGDSARTVLQPKDRWQKHIPSREED